jgi:hypothetical protein
MKSILRAGIFEVQKQMRRPTRTYINLQYIKANPATEKEVTVCTSHQKHEIS